VYVVSREIGEVHRETWWGDLMKGDHIEDLRVDGNKILKLIFKKSDSDTDLIKLALRTGTVGDLL
jgi:hypothetical protein